MASFSCFEKIGWRRVKLPENDNNASSCLTWTWICQAAVESTFAFAFMKDKSKSKIAVKGAKEWLNAIMFRHPRQKHENFSVANCSLNLFFEHQPI